MWNLVAKIFGGIGILTALFLGLRLLWLNPETVNPAARGYLAHVSRLQSDSTRLRGRVAHLDSLLVDRDTTIARLSSEARTALAYGQQWQARYANQVAVSDATTDRLTDKERELSYYRALQANGTLTATETPSTPFTADEPAVIQAGLKTANREVIARRTADSLSLTVGYLQAANQRLGAGLKTATSGLSLLSKAAYAKGKRGGIWPFNARRRNEEQQISRSLDSLNVEVENVSEIERILNNEKP